jgi:hypothetical protein
MLNPIVWQGGRRAFVFNSRRRDPRFSRRAKNQGIAVGNPHGNPLESKHRPRIRDVSFFVLNPQVKSQRQPARPPRRTPESCKIVWCLRGRTRTPVSDGYNLVSAKQRLRGL